MKKYIFTIFILSFLLINLSGCSDPDASLMTQSSGTGAAVNTTSAAVKTTEIESTDIHITVNAEHKTSIPDPATAEKNITITLRDPDQDTVFDNYDCKQCDLDNEEYCSTCKKYFLENYFADLSFAGFEKPVHISSFAIGSMTEKDSSAVQFYLRKKMRLMRPKKRETVWRCSSLLKLMKRQINWRIL